MKNWIFILLSILLFGCSSKNDSFYESTGGLDYTRIPLLQPYEAINTGNGWHVILNKHPYSGSIAYSAININVIDSIIIFYSDKSHLSFNKESDSSWSFIIPAKGIHVEFLSKKEFGDSLACYTNSQVHFIPIDTVYKRFVENDYLPWYKKN